MLISPGCCAFRICVVAVNKMDLVDYDQKVFADIRAAFAEFAADLSFRDVIYIPMSALKGDMVVERGNNLPWYDGPALLELLGQHRDRPRPQSR